MAKITIGGLRKIIKEELEKAMEEMGSKAGPKYISREELADMCPQAEEGLDGLTSNTNVPVDHDDNFWYVESPEEAFAISGERALGITLKKNWDSISCDGKVYMCGPEHEEYGLFWDNSENGWNSWTDTAADDEPDDMGFGDDEDEAQFEIPDVSDRAAAAGMSVDEFVDMVIGMGKKYPNIEFGPPNALDTGNGYSSEYDSLLAMGSRSELESLAKELDEELMGGAQSINDEDSFVNFVSDV